MALSMKKMKVYEGLTIPMGFLLLKKLLYKKGHPEKTLQSPSRSGKICTSWPATWWIASLGVGIGRFLLGNVGLVPSPEGGDP